MGPDLDPRFAEYRKSRDRAIRNALIEANTAIADRLARRYSGRGVPDDDLHQVALLGLLGAVERFDPERGVPFGAYASRTVEGELRRFFRERTWTLSVPRRAKEAWLVVRRAEEQLTGTLGRSPTVAEIAETTGLSFDEVVLGLESEGAYRAGSLDEPGPGVTAASVEEGFRRVQHEAEVEDLLARLPEREAAIVRMRFYGELTQQRIADELGISQMHVSRLLRRALERLRELVSD